MITSQLYKPEEQIEMSTTGDRMQRLHNDLVEAKSLIVHFVRELSIVEYENDPPERVLKLFVEAARIQAKGIPGVYSQDINDLRNFIPTQYECMKGLEGFNISEKSVVKRLQDKNERISELEETLKAIEEYNLLKTENELMRAALKTCVVVTRGSNVEFLFNLPMVNDALSGCKDGVLIRGLDVRRI